MRLLLLVVAVALSAACEPAAPTVYFGDSNMAMVASRLDGTVHATPGYSIDDWAAEMADVDDGATVVVALGSNDVLEGDELAVVDMRNAVALLPGDGCVVWVTVNVPSFDALGLGGEARAFNEWVRSEPGVTVVEWSTSQVQPADPVHLTAAGYDEYATVLAAAPDQCGGGS